MSHKTKIKNNKVNRDRKTRYKNTYDWLNKLGEIKIDEYYYNRIYEEINKYHY